jgi:hypothetical protein
MKVFFCELDKRWLTRAEMAAKNHNGCGLCGRVNPEPLSKAAYLLWRFKKLPISQACLAGKMS